MSRFLAVLAAVASFAAAAPLTGHAQQPSTVDVLTGPDSTPNVLRADARQKDPVLDVGGLQRFDEWKVDLKKRTGFDFAPELDISGFRASSSPGARNALGSSFRFIMQWDLVDRDGPNTGSLVLKPEYRYSSTAVTPVGFGLELGYAGLLNGLLNDQHWRLTHGHWMQKFAQGRGFFNIGWLDITDYADIFVLASPWSFGFQNTAFETGSNVFGDLPDGSLGAMVGGFLTDNVYAMALSVDANGNASDPWQGFNTLFKQGQLWSAVEIGWTADRKDPFLTNGHVTLYTVDARTTLDGAPIAPRGRGVAVSLTKKVGDAWLPFFRAGWGDGGGAFYSASVSVGFGYSQNPSRSIAGVGLNWGRPMAETFGPGLRDQWTLEAFQMWQVTHRLQVIPSVQVLQHPALNPDKNTIWVGGLRLRWVL